MEAARSEVFSALNVATTLRHAIQHAEEASQRVGDELSKLAMEESELRMEQERLEGWIMKEVGKGLALPGLYPANAETKARYEADKAAGRI